MFSFIEVLLQLAVQAKQQSCPIDPYILMFFFISTGTDVFQQRAQAQRNVQCKRVSWMKAVRGLDHEHVHIRTLKKHIDRHTLQYGEIDLLPA